MSIDIILNVYLLADSRDTENLNRVTRMSQMGIGLYHTAIEIQGVEYSYGGNINNSGSGVFTSCPLMVANATYLCSYNIGSCSDFKKVYDVLNETKLKFKANEYSLINQNCNHFSEAFCLSLLGKRIPSYINRIASIGSWVQFLMPRSLKSLNPIPSDHSDSSTRHM